MPAAYGQAEAHRLRGTSAACAAVFSQYLSPMCNLYKMRGSAAEVAQWSNAMTTPGLNFAETVYPGYQGLVIESGKLLTMTLGLSGSAEAHETHVKTEAGHQCPQRQAPFLVLETELRSAEVPHSGDRVGRAAGRAAQDDLHLAFAA